MTVLADWQIRYHCEADSLVEPFEEELLNPASIDVRLGNKIMIEVADQPRLIQADISNRTASNPYRMVPGEFCLAEVQEVIKLPASITAQFLLKSSRGREGYEHLMAGFVDPGYHGRLTLELKNMRRHYELPLYPGLKIGQLVFHRTCGTPLVTYNKTGRYQGDLKVTASRG